MNRLEFLLDGVMAVIYFEQVIAIIDSSGRIVWRDVRFPLFLVEHLVLQPDHSKDKWN